MSEETPREQEEKAGLDDRRKNALLRYVAILFAVAFLVVLLSLITQMRDNRNTITQLNQSSSSALQKAEQLQDTNRVLEENNVLLKNEVADLEAQVEALKTQLQDLEAEKQAILDEQKEADKIKDVTRAYELLLQLEGDETGSVKKSLETYHTYLGPKGLETYEAILAMEKGVE